MQLGICTSVDKSVAVKTAGWDFVEEGVQALLQGTVPDAQWQGAERAAASALPVLAANGLVPGTLKITGPKADLTELRPYMRAVISRAAAVGMKTLVFGSGAARNVPDGFARDEAKEQIIEFAKMSAEIASEYDLTLVAEPLNKGECNIINTVAEAMGYVNRVDHPNFQCLVDSYHFWLEDEPLENLEEAMPWIKHVHVADKEGRVAPGLSGTSDYKPFFAVLKEGGYDGPISVEALGVDPTKDTSGVRTFLRDQWNQA